MSSNKYGYVADTGPEQSFQNNPGVFDPADINNLIADNKWTNYGQLELIETKTFSGTVSAVDFIDIKETEYDIHYMTLSNMKTAGDNQESCTIQLYENGVLETASVYQFGVQNNSTISGLENYERKSTGASAINFNFGAGNDTGEQDDGYFYFYNLGDSSKYSFVTGQFVGLSNASKIYTSFGSALLPQASQVDGIRVKKNTGDYAGFKISLYGIKEYS